MTPESSTHYFYFGKDHAHYFPDQSLKASPRLVQASLDPQVIPDRIICTGPGNKVCKT